MIPKYLLCSSCESWVLINTQYNYIAASEKYKCGLCGFVGFAKDTVAKNDLKHILKVVDK